MKTRLKSLVRLVTEATDFGPQPFVALESVDVGTGRLLNLDAIREAELPSSGAASVRAGDVLFGKLRPYLEKTWLVDRSAYASTELLCMRPGSHVSSRWLAYLVRSRPFIDWAVATSDGAKMPRTSWEKLAQFQFAVPALAIQRSATDYLDRETARIDALIVARQRMVELLHERWEALRIALVTGSTGAFRGSQNGPEWMGRVPREWSIERLKFLARMDSGHTPDRKIEAYWVDCTIPWVTLNDVGRLQQAWTITDSVNAINELGMANSAAHILPVGAVILSRDATVGRAAILGRPMTVSQHFVGWITGSRLMPEYLLHVLRGPMQRYFATLTAGATIATIGMPELNDLLVPVPPQDEQERIVAELRSAEDHFNRARAALIAQVDLLHERRQALITTAVTGQLDIPEAA